MQAFKGPIEALEKKFSIIFFPELILAKALFQRIIALRVQYLNLGGLLLSKGRGAYHLFIRTVTAISLEKELFSSRLDFRT